MAKSGVTPCGWCMDGFHDGCVKQIKHYDTIWYCPCEECPTSETEEVNDEATL